MGHSCTTCTVKMMDWPVVGSIPVDRRVGEIYDPVYYTLRRVETSLHLQQYQQISALFPREVLPKMHSSPNVLGRSHQGRRDVWNMKSEWGK
jgi:hypothetical protein